MKKTNQEIQVYQPLWYSENATVVIKKTNQPNFNRHFENEATLQQAMIAILKNQSYQYCPEIQTEQALIANLKKQIERLNNYTFTTSEWSRFYEYLTKNSIIKNAKMFHQDGHVFSFQLDSGIAKNFYIVDKKHLYDNNQLQVINYQNKNHLTILVNGLPLVQIEIIHQAISLESGLNAIENYLDQPLKQIPLFNWIQIFVMANGIETCYYANTARQAHLEYLKRPTQINHQSNGSLLFINRWADQDNEVINESLDFTKTFFARHTLLNILTKYCVFNVQNQLLVMRPYQIVAVENIINLINYGQNNQWAGTKQARGYIWHATGSGKTLTAFKTSQLSKYLNQIDKVIHVVDRQDLDSQTVTEFEKFQKNSVKANHSTTALKTKLLSNDDQDRVLVTTIQKLNLLIANPSGKISKSEAKTIYQKTCIFIFDECHRSQFGQMHQNIVKNFKNHYLFGFSGTPIFSHGAKAPYQSINKLATINQNSLGAYELQTTTQLFGKCLGIYTMAHAINDNNTLKFKVDEVDTFTKQTNIKDKKVKDINRVEILHAPARIKNNIKLIIAKYQSRTMRNPYQASNHNGFNSLLTCDSIAAAKLYYHYFKQIQAQLGTNLKIAMIYSAQATNLKNSEQYINNQFLQEEIIENINHLNQSDRNQLNQAINDYNQIFQTNFNIINSNQSGFEDYYLDVGRRMKNNEIDLLIVVNMFLTGFDAACINTLWVDRLLKNHGLIQAVSRTNRIANNLKTHGNIISFQPIEDAFNAAFTTYSNGNQDLLKILVTKSFNEYYNTGYYDENNRFIHSYQDLVSQFKAQYQIAGDIDDDNPNLTTESSKREYIKHFGKIIKLRALLLCFDEFTNRDLLTNNERLVALAYYQQYYHDLKTQYPLQQESIIKDVQFESEIVKSFDIGEANLLKAIYLLLTSTTSRVKIAEEITLKIRSSASLRSKEKLIEAFINTYNPSQLPTFTSYVEEFNNYRNQSRYQAIAQIAADHNLDLTQLTTILEEFWKQSHFNPNHQLLNKLLDNYPNVTMFDKLWLKQRQSLEQVIKNCYEAYLS